MLEYQSQEKEILEKISAEILSLADKEFLEFSEDEFLEAMKDLGIPTQEESDNMIPIEGKD